MTARTLLGLAARNLGRYRKRTALTAGAIAVGIALFISMDAWLLGARTDSERNLEAYETGDGAVRTAEFTANRDRFPLEHTIGNTDQVVSALREAGYSATARLETIAELIVYFDPYPEDGNFPVILSGINTDTDGDVFRLEGALEAGRLLEGPEDTGVVIGAWLAEDLGAEVGFPVTFSVRTLDGFRQIIDGEIAGIVRSENPETNRSLAAIPLARMQELLEAPDRASSVYFQAGGRAEPADVAAEVRELISRELPDRSGLTVQHRDELAPGAAAASDADRSSIAVILVLLVIIALVGVSNTMLIALNERRREIGMMRALGMEDGQIQRLYLYEAFGIGLIGSLLGLVLGALLAWPLIRWGVDFSAFLRDLDVGYRVSGVFRGAWHPLVMVLSVPIGPVLAVLVALRPVRRELKHTIVESLIPQN